MKIYQYPLCVVSTFIEMTSPTEKAGEHLSDGASLSSIALTTCSSSELSRVIRTFLSFFINLSMSFSFLCLFLSLLCFVCSAFLLFLSSYQKLPHPTSLERKLDLEEKRDTNAYSWSKRRTCRKN